MMTPPINYDSLPYLFDPYIAEECASSLQGLAELKAEQQAREEKTHTLASNILLASGAILAATVFLSLVTTAVTMLTVGIAGLGLMAAGVYYVYQRVQTGEKEINQWVEIFTLIVNGEADEALPLLRQQLTAEALARPDFIPNGDVEGIFKPAAYQNYASLDIREAHVSQTHTKDYGRYLLKTIYAKVLLAGIFQKLNQMPTAEERRTFLDEVKPELILCKRMFQDQRCGIIDAQKQALFLLVEADDQAITDHLQEIELPQIISVGHGFLLGILQWMDNVPVEFVNLCQDPQLIGKEFGGNHLENWAATLVKAREWLTNENQLGELEEKFMTSLEASKDMREFWKVCHSLSKDERKLLNQRAVQYQA